MSILVVIPAREGSKGIINKNNKLLNGKPLFQYSLEVAKSLFSVDDICVSTDSLETISIAEKLGVKIPFVRPKYLSTDQATTEKVLLHALRYYEKRGKEYSTIILLQPTSPLRQARHLKEAISLYTNQLDMIVSVKESKSNPYLNLFEEQNGMLTKSKPSNFSRRQDAPKVYALNGAIYVINSLSLKRQSIYQFKKVKKYVMDDYSSLDIDTPSDWKIAELVISKNLYENN